MFRRLLKPLPRCSAPKCLAPKCSAPKCLAPNCLELKCLAPKWLAPKWLAPKWLALKCLGLVCLALAGCASAVEGTMLFGDAGKYQYHDCEQLAAAAKNQIKREQELKELITRAEGGAGGIFVSLLAYKSDYVAVEEDLRVIETTARNKKCPTLNSWQSNSVIQ